MGLAIGSMKVGFAYLVDGELMDWKLSIDASQSEEAAFDQAVEWIGYYRLDVLVLEDPEHSRKGNNSLLLHRAVMRAAVAAEVRVILMAQHPDGAPNQYARAAYLANEFPQIRPWLPDPRRVFDQEPRNIVLFEALSLCWRWWKATGGSEEEELGEIAF